MDVKIAEQLFQLLFISTIIFGFNVYIQKVLINPPVIMPNLFKVQGKKIGICGLIFFIGFAAICILSLIFNRQLYLMFWSWLSMSLILLALGIILFFQGRRISKVEPRKLENSMKITYIIAFVIAGISFLGFVVTLIIQVIDAIK